MNHGSLLVTVDGLPTGVPAGVAVNGPNGYFKAITGSTTLTDLVPGPYTIFAGDVAFEESVYAGAPASGTAIVRASETTSATPVSYALATGFLSVSFAGLPATVAAQIVITGPGGYQRTVTQPLTIAGLRPGTYTVEAQQVTASSSTWTPVVGTLSVQVAAVLAPTTASFAYTLSSGALMVTVNGLPNGVAPMVRLSGPGNFAAVVTATSTITNMVPGTYTITPEPVVLPDETYRAPGPLTVQVPVGETPVTASVTYALATGRLTLSAGGPPTAASQASFQVTGPQGFTATAPAGTTLTALVPGAYTVNANTVNTGTATYVPSPASQVVNVAASATPTVATATYNLATGSLLVSITGLPQGATPAVTVTGPNGFSVSLETSTTLHNLAPGSYAVAAGPVTSGLHGYAPSPAQQPVTVLASLTPASATVTYALNTGLLAIAVSGLPNGVAAAITVTGPNGYQQAVTGSVTLAGLLAGTYQVNAAVVTAGGTFAPTPGSQTVAITPSTVIVNRSVAYAPAVNSLTVNVAGLPLGTNASIAVNGPGGFVAAPVATQSFTGIPAGQYTITASAVGQTCALYAPTVAVQVVNVGAADAVSVDVAYSSGSGAGLNLCVDNAYITQSIQSYAGSVPLVANRNGLVRVFVRANQGNGVQPSVRVRLYQGTSLVHTLSIPSPGASVPQSVDEGTLGSSWNAPIAGSLIQPGLRILADVDPTNAVVETSDLDNAWPPSGLPVVLDVRPVTTLNVRLVPVVQQNGDTGRVSDANKAAFVDPMMRMFPLAAIDADVHAPFITSAPQLQSGGSNWNTLLSEINALRVAEGATRYYYGIVRVGYSSGVAGLGYIGLPAAIGWDYPASGPGVMAHELGHNFGRLHAPCGNPSGVDPLWPSTTNPNAVIGHFGYDIVAGVLLSSTSQYDLMSYCSPDWISDYTYKAILNYRTSNPTPMVAGARVPAAATRGLLVWGRIERGRPVLEPAFEVDAPAVLPSRPGPHRLEAIGPAGERIYSASFAGDRIADLPDPNEETFAFVIPLTAFGGREPARLRLAAQGREVEQRASGAPSAPTMSRTTAGRVRVSWDPTTARAALVRNARTGQVLAIGRGGMIDLPATADELDVTLSDGVRSLRRRLR